MTTRELTTAHGHWLWLAGAAFAARVVAQPAARLTGWSWLPPFAAWQSGALPYAWLLAAQIAILAWMARTAWLVSHDAERRDRGRGRLVGIAAALYGAVMLTRLALGLTAFAGHWWLDAPLPTIFHLVIASYLAIYAHYHWRVHPPLRSQR